MSTTTEWEPAVNQLADAGREAVDHAAETARDLYHRTADQAGDALATSKDYVSRNPIPVFLGALAVGAALGYLVMSSRRKPTFGERYTDEPMAAVRNALLGALAPVSQRVHSGYDAAMDGAGKAMDRMHRFGPGNSFSHRLGRLGNNLKFW